MRPTPISLFILLPSLILASSCGIGIGDKDTSEDPGDDSGTEDTDDTQGGTDSDSDEFDPDENVNVIVTGNITVQPYTLDSEGDVVLRDWADIGTSFPFGPIFVASFTNEAGVTEHHGETSIMLPSTAPNYYTLRVGGTGLTEINLYSSLDYWNDGVIDGEDPVGVYPDPLPVHNGDVIDNVDMVIMARYDGGGGDGDADGDADADADADADTDTDTDADSDPCGITVSGDYTITLPYGGGTVGTMIRVPGTDYPYRHRVDWSIPTPTATGATGTYSLDLCKDDGEVNLIAGWDSNGNYLLDPADQWGAYALSPGVNGNPILVETESLVDYDIEIPIGDGGSPWEAVPFIRISGDVSLYSGSFADLSPTAILYVTALKYRPEIDLSVSELEEAYDTDTFAYKDISSLSSVPYSIIVPADNIVYLWAYIDDDGDGNLNEHGDIVGPPVDYASGRIGTGTSNLEDVDIVVRRVED